MKKCVFAGTFDPFTVGHEDAVKKCLRLFDEVVVAVCENTQKRTMFSAEERKNMICACFEGNERVCVRIFTGVVVDLLREEGTPVYVRGLRNATDYDYETADFYASRDLYDEMITVYVPCEQKYSHVSSTLVKNCLHFKKPTARYVPAAVEKILQEKREKGNV